MRAAAAIVMIPSAAGAAGAQSSLGAEVRALADRYHETPSPFTGLRVAEARRLPADSPARS